jgi:hypothetical protein
LFSNRCTFGSHIRHRCPQGIIKKCKCNIQLFFFNIVPKSSLYLK